MTTTLAPQEPLLPLAKARRWAFPGWATALFVVAFGLRYFHIVPSYNLFIDEVTYSEIARNIAEGRGVTHYGEPFDLHPPVVLGTFGLALRILGPGGDLAELAFALRPVTALFGAGTVVLTYLIGRRAGFGTGLALCAAALVAVDPFQVRYDSLVMLEAQTQFFAALTIFLVMTRPSRRLLIVAGLCAGITFCSKETFGLVLGAALIGIGLVGRRKEVGVVIGIGLGGYLANLVLTIWLGGLDAWMRARGNGLTRLVGLNQETGFNSDTVKVSLFSRLTANFDRLAVTYALLLLGGICCLLLIRRLREPETAIVAWTLAACGYLGYATVLGSIEEQMYYIPLVPCVLCLTAVLARSTGSLKWILIAVFLMVDAVVWVRGHTTDSNIYRQFLTWAQTGVPKGSRVALTEDSAQFVLSGLELGSWHTAEQVRRNDVDYVLINPRLVEQGYGLGDPAFLDYLRASGDPVFTASSAADGTLVLYRLSGPDQ